MLLWPILGLPRLALEFQLSYFLSDLSMSLFL